MCDNMNVQCGEGTPLTFLVCVPPPFDLRSDLHEVMPVAEEHLVASTSRKRLAVRGRGGTIVTILRGLLCSAARSSHSIASLFIT